jgi:hypothetical protein
MAATRRCLRKLLLGGYGCPYDCQNPVLEERHRSVAIGWRSLYLALQGFKVSERKAAIRRGQTPGKERKAKKNCIGVSQAYALTCPLEVGTSINDFDREREWARAIFGDLPGEPGMPIRPSAR